MNIKKTIEVTFCIIGILLLFGIFLRVGDLTFTSVFVFLSLLIFELLYTIGAIFKKQTIQKDAKEMVAKQQYPPQQYRQPIQETYNQPTQQHTYQQQPQYQQPIPQPYNQQMPQKQQNEPIFEQNNLPFATKRNEESMYAHPEHFALQQQKKQVYEQYKPQHLPTLNMAQRQQYDSNNIVSEEDKYDVPPEPPFGYAKLQHNQAQAMPTEQNNATNEGEKFVCDICGRECSGVFGLQSHKRLKHKITK